MRTPILAGNWKMYKSAAEAAAFARAFVPAVAAYPSVTRALCAPFTTLPALADALRGSDVLLGAQTMHWEPEGAFTGQVSARHVAEFAQLVILGHSECRAYLGETDEQVNKKLHAALAAGLTPIVAVGESLATNDAGDTVPFVRAQVEAALAGVPADAMPGVVLAYEPIWAIGTGRSASADEANRIIAEAVRAPLADLYGPDVAQQVRIQYGGSVKPDNMAAYMAQPDIDGALVGGASLTVESLVALVRIAAEQKGR